MLYNIEKLHQTTTTKTDLAERMGLYNIEKLHQTTTTTLDTALELSLYNIEKLHQTTTRPRKSPSIEGCIILKNYIKPQL